MQSYKNSDMLSLMSKKRELPPELRKRREKLKEQVRKSLAKRRERLLREGKCLQCGLVDPVPGRTLCAACRDQNKATQRKREQKRGGGVLPEVNENACDI